MERIDEGRSGSPAHPGTGSGADSEVEIMEDDDTAHGAGAKEGAGGSARQGGGSAPQGSESPVLSLYFLSIEANPLFFVTQWASAYPQERTVGLTEANLLYSLCLPLAPYRTPLPTPRTLQ